MADKFEFVKLCPECGKEQKLILSKVAYENWKSKKQHIQHAFPELSSEQREILLSGVCPDCWIKLFAEETEDETYLY